MNNARRLRILLAAIALLAAVGQAHAGQNVPLRGSSSLSTQVTVIEPGVQWLVEGTGEGNATHVGRFHAVFHYDVFVQTGQVTGWVRGTAANGDQFGGDVTGQWLPGGNAQGIVTLNFGTGRFQNATGSATFTSSLNGVTFDGTISY